MVGGCAVGVGVAGHGVVGGSVSAVNVVRVDVGSGYGVGVGDDVGICVCVGGGDGGGVLI